MDKISEFVSVWVKLVTVYDAEFFFFLYSMMMMGSLNV